MTIVPLPYQPEFEVEEEDEANIARKILQPVSYINEETFRKTGHAERASHSKSTGLLQAELRVSEDLPVIYAQGVFSNKGSSYPTIMRFSTAPGDILPDNISTSRGLSIKIGNVSGERLPGSEQETAQDFITVNHPVFFVKNANRVLQNFRMLAPTTERVPGLKRVISLMLQPIEKLLETIGIKSVKLEQMGGQREVHMLGETYYSQVPFLYGPYMAKLAIAPASGNLLSLHNQHVDLSNNPDGLREAIVAFFATETAVWNVQIQLCTDIESMPVEDPTVRWPEEQSPFVTVAQLIVKPQSAWNPESSRKMDDELSFRPWNGISAHKPLGAVMRARKQAYEFSSRTRARLNRCPMHASYPD